MTSNDIHVEAVKDKLTARSIAGQAKYGCTMERTDLTHLQWLQHAQEEVMDLAIYLERIMHNLKEQQ